jgi:hypothetical protein
MLGLLRLNASAAAGEEQEDQHIVVQLTKGYLLAIGQAVEQAAAAQPAVEQQLWAYVVARVKTPMSQQQFAAVCKKLVRTRRAAADGNAAGSSNLAAPAPLRTSAAAAATVQAGGQAVVVAAVTPGKTLPSEYGATASSFAGWGQREVGDVQHAQHHHRQQQQQQATALRQQAQANDVNAGHAAAHERSR